jgi:hypothetical protein
MMITKSAFLVVLGCLLSACAVGNKFDVRQAIAVAPKGGSTVAVGGLDERELLRKGEIEPEYVGMTRGGYGNPFLVKTASKQPFAQEAAQVVAASLGGRVRGPVRSYSTREAALHALRATGAQRLALLRVKSWESDTLINTSVNIDLVLEVYNSAGKLLASSSDAAYRDLGGNIASPPMHARKVVIAELGRSLTKLMEQPAVASALR